MQKPDHSYAKPRGDLTYADERTISEFASWYQSRSKMVSAPDRQIMKPVLDLLDREDLTRQLIFDSIKGWGAEHGQTLIHFTDHLELAVREGVGEGYDPERERWSILQDMYNLAAPIRRSLDEKDPERPAH